MRSSFFVLRSVVFAFAASISWFATTIAASGASPDPELCFKNQAEVTKAAIVYAARSKACPGFVEIGANYRHLSMDIRDYWFKPGMNTSECRELAMEIWRRTWTSTANEANFCSNAKRIAVTP